MHYGNCNCAGLTDWHKYLNCFQLSGTQTVPLLETHSAIPRRFHWENATTFCFQHKFLEVCVCLCQPLLQSIIYCYSVLLGGISFYALIQTKAVVIFFSPKWWNRWITRVVSWCLETSAETTKYSFKNGHHIKKQVEVEGFDALSRYMFWFDLCARVRFLFLALDLLNI